MRRRRREHGVVRAAVAFALLAWGGPSAADPGRFTDPLDVPSAASALASRRGLSGVSAPGGAIVAVGQRGHVVVSRDGGATWRQASVPVSVDLTAVWFASARRGWAVGHSGVVLSTDDGGATWTKRLDRHDVQRAIAAYRADPASRRIPGLLEQVEVLSAEDADVSFLDVWFADERTGFAVGAFNLAMRTDDGGRTWSPWLHRVANPRGYHLQSVRRAGGRVYVAGEHGLLLVLDASVERFERVPLAFEGTLLGVTGDDRQVVIFGLAGHAFRSDDGVAWQPLTTGTRATLAAGATLPDGRVLLATRSGELIAVGQRPLRSPGSAATSPVSALAAAGAGVVLAGPGGVRVERVE